MEKQGDGLRGIDPYKTTETLEPETTDGGGLHIPVKDRPTYRAPEKKSRLGLDVRASEKREVSRVAGGFKVPKERVASVAASINEEEKFESFGTDEARSIGKQSHFSRQYREKFASSQTWEEDTVTVSGQISNKSEAAQSLQSNLTASSVGSSRSVSYRNSSYERYDRDGERRDHRDDRKSESTKSRQRFYEDSEERYHGRESRHRYEQERVGEYGGKRRRYEGARRTPGRKCFSFEVF
ncbi:pre-mRNA-splicing factor ATP-dependent RNA helicase DEAH7-like [Carica papaya]|uniref:pre-mRNA-splicing factor ATP-dependent RNA helicase DEAH7-like n=1 Tax=Carica papaya TaxID=3649 RepID=UPI000B8CC5A0|nr:pre-mRNA-splicing factor ATP-dependent RNA helicase DEAH7-like [Carica papaya]